MRLRFILAATFGLLAVGPVILLAWGITAPQPLDELIGRMDLVKPAAAVAILLGLLLATTVGWLLSGMLVRPLADLTDRMAELAAGDPSARMLPPGRLTPREFRHLAGAFNEMASTISADTHRHRTTEHGLRDARDELESRVDQRTQRLAESEARLREAQSIAHLGSWSRDLSTNTMILSEEQYRLFGWDPAGPEPNYNRFIEAVHPDDRKMVVEALVETIAGRRELDIEFRIRRPSGEIRHLHSQGALSRTPDTDEFRLVGTNLDITQYAQTQAALVDAKLEAEASDRVKSEFLANVSHELRTPLNAIIGFSEALYQKVFGPLGNEKQEEYIRNIFDSGCHLLELINDILDVSTIEANHLQLDQENFQLEDVVESVLRMLKPRAQDGEVSLICDLAAMRHTLFLDKRRLKQVLVNLMSNSVKFTQSGGSVRLTAKRNAESTLSITVSDTGIGMRPEEIKLAMEPFGRNFRADGTAYEGTGLGLPLTKMLTEAMGGEFTLESEPGKGTQVQVSFPLPDAGRTTADA